MRYCSLLLPFALALLPSGVASASIDARGNLSDVGGIIVSSANRLLREIPSTAVPAIGVMCLDTSLGDVSASEADALLAAAVKKDDPNLAELTAIIADVKEREQVGALPLEDYELFNRMGLALVNEPMNDDLFDSTICTSVLRPRAPVIAGEYAVMAISFTYKDMAGAFSAPFFLTRRNGEWFIALKGEGHALVF